MIEASDKCTGCMACKFVCPKAAVTMKENEEGFLYPKVDFNLCTDCNLCIKVCPIEKPINYDYSFKQRYFAARMKDRKQRLETQSGGACNIFSEVAVGGGKGAVYGVGFDNDWNAIHKRATDREGIIEFRNSKYVQSNIENVFRYIICDIKNNDIEKIVITGTPCQVAGIKAYLNQSKQPLDKILFVDIICHGVPSPKVWRDYLKNEYGKKRIFSIKFRDKRFGWSSHIETVTYRHKAKHSRRYTHLFHMEVINRRCCATCKYASYKRESDITVGDFWGYSKAGIGYDSFGISECLINTDKGQKFFRECTNDLLISDITKEQADQWNLNHPTQVDIDKRNVFWQLYKNGGYTAVRDTYCYDEIKGEWRMSIFYFLKSFKRLFLGR